MRTLSIFLLFVCLALAGCADSDQGSDQHSRFGGFYGGISGGGGAAR